MRRSPRTRAALCATLTALLTTATAAGPGAGAAIGGPCALPRLDVHHSLGLDTWHADYPRPLGRLDAVLLFLSFPDSEPRGDPREVADSYLPATPDFLHRASYGRFTLAPEVVDEWIAMPAASDAYEIARDWEPEARHAYLRDAFAAVADRADLAAFDLVYLVADPDAPGVDSDATKVVNFDGPVRVGDAELRRVVTVFENRPPDRHVLAHETGHLFDLPDLYRRPAEGAGDWDTHVGDWDLMGSQFGLAPEPFGWHKWKLGWLDAAHVACLAAPGTLRTTLRPLTAPLDAPPDAPLEGADAAGAAEADGSDGSGGSGGSGGGGGGDGAGGADTRLAVVRTGPHEALVAEARTRAGNDAAACREGVLLYRVRADVASAEGPVEVVDGHPGSEACRGRSVQPELADAPLGAGESYHDAETGVRVSVGEGTPADGWRVEIERTDTE